MKSSCLNSLSASDQTWNLKNCSLPASRGWQWWFLLMLIRLSQSSMSVFSFLGRARNTVYERSLLCCIVKRKNYCHMESKRVELNKEIRFWIGKEGSDLHNIKCTEIIGPKTKAKLGESTSKKSSEESEKTKKNSDNPSVSSNSTLNTLSQTMIAPKPVTFTLMRGTNNQKGRCPASLGYVLWCPKGWSCSQPYPAQASGR